MYVYKAWVDISNSMSSDSDTEAAGDSDADVAATGEKTSDKPSLLDDRARTHVLDGDGPKSGGHRAGTGKPGKSEFPAEWSDERIEGEISDVATDPSSTRTPIPGGREAVTGTRGGVDIKVILDKDGRIITEYPTNRPRNPQ
jgi:hypothetical protein